MSSFNLVKKLLPAKKAWKRFTQIFQSKLHNVKISKPVKKLTHHLKSIHSIRGLIPRKIRARALCKSHYDHHRHYYYNHHQLQKSFAAIYVEDLFEGPKQTNQPKGASKAKEMGSTSSAKIIDHEKTLRRERKANETSTSGVVGDAWKGIDERAEEFISKFREDMNLQREQSIINFQEMLARSA